MKKIALSLLVASALFTSCSSDDNSSNNNNVDAPAAYQFERNGISTVSYSGQTDRLLMGGELGSALKNSSNTEAILDGMFTNTGNYFSNEELNNSTKDIRSKTAASTDYYSANTTESNAIKADFDGWISSQVNEVFPNWNTDASAGVAGNIEDAGGTTRYVSAKGLEYDQAFVKGLIGALTADQILNNYLSTSVLDEGDNRTNNDNNVLLEGANYTNMEHKWDEAFGYLYGTDNPVAPELNQDSFLNKYLLRVNSDEDFSDFAETIYDAFKLGRAAIVAKDYDLRDEQAEIIREKISEVIGIRAVYYLQAGKESLGTDYASAFHSLSEGYGFVYSLQFTRQPNTNVPYFTRAEVQTYLDQLMAGNGFWDVTSTTLDEIAEDIAARFNFTLEEASN
ncbi:DUF4856 domain-containing protein [Winogradskyella pulchriflava]|uniref:DUF4856 domain-containing protein n=1 Tax=Winogradskyella pulchriflava TaxID=1110688 RepID=A0ABV6QDQ8_9FLAO